MVSTKKHRPIPRSLTLPTNRTQMMSPFLRSAVLLMLVIMYRNQSLSTFLDLRSYSQLLLLMLLMLLLLLLLLHQFLVV